MPEIYTCPYWRYEKAGRSFCEACRLHFQRVSDMAQYKREHCLSVTGWQDCSLAQQLNKRYE